MELRFAKEGDNAELLKIYAQYINTGITFECVLPTKEEFAQRIADITENYPYLVCREAGRTVGYAYAHRQMEREAYQWNAELSIYLDGSAVSRGIGKKLYGALTDILRLQGVKTVYSVVTLPNEKSEKLNYAMGARLIGVCRNTGYKDGKWRDVGWFENQIAPYEEAPAPIRSIRTLPQAELEAVLKKYM